MKNVKPCPYCGGEVEVIKLEKTERELKNRMPQPYRIECRCCRALVARGQGFPVETDAQMKERIDDYNRFISNKYVPSGFNNGNGRNVHKFDRG